ncbi:MAG: FxsA family protein [Candidatus Schmidhempelia sp.]|nr:FxsA family protein [Candidatus Schmidhempelia sp.]
MKQRWLLVLLIYLYLEIKIFVAVANQIGVLLTLISFIMTSFIGKLLLKRQRITPILSMQTNSYLDENHSQQPKPNIAVVLAGLLLVIPGFLSDILGACLLIPFIQTILTKYVMTKIKSNIYFESVFMAKKHQQSEEDIIEGTFSYKHDE